MYVLSEACKSPYYFPISKRVEGINLILDIKKKTQVEKIIGYNLT